MLEDKMSLEKPYYNAVLSMANSVPSESLVLDVGCGENPHVFHKWFDSYVGLDVDIDTLKRVSKRLPDISTVRASGLHLPFKNCIFALVICTEVLEHLQNHEKALEEINRVLARKGITVISVPSLSLPQTLILWIAHKTKRISSKPFQSPDHLREYARFRVTPHFERTSDMFKLLEVKGFRIQKVATAQSLYTSPKTIYDHVIFKLEKIVDRMLSPLLFGHYVIVKSEKVRACRVE